MFAGRLKELAAILDAISNKGQHAVVYGERGVGKTSLVSVLGPIMESMPNPDFRALVVRQNCTGHTSFGRLWKSAFGEVVLAVRDSKIGFTGSEERSPVSLAEQSSSDPGPAEVIGLLRKVPSRIVFVFDEFDRIESSDVTKAFADTIKALSDHAAMPTVVIVGVGDDVQSLLEAHGSIERALVQIRMPRMVPDELAAIVDKGAAALGMTFVDQARERLVRFSQGLPHYVHLLGLHSARAVGFLRFRGHRMKGEYGVRHGSREGRAASAAAA